MEKRAKRTCTLVPASDVFKVHRILDLHHNAVTVCKVRGSEILTDSLELFRKPLLLLGRLTNPEVLSRRKSTGRMERISPVLNRQ